MDNNVGLARIDNIEVGYMTDHNYLNVVMKLLYNKK